MIMFVFWFWLYLQSHSCCLEATDPFGLSVFILVDQVVFVVIVTNEPAFFVDALVAPPVELCGDFLAEDFLVELVWFCRVWSLRRLV